jgi:hypothetical protein
VASVIQWQPLVYIDSFFIQKTIFSFFNHLAVYLAVPIVNFSVHPFKKRFHFLNGRFEFWKRRFNFLSPILISIHNIATKKMTSLFWEIKRWMKWVCQNVSSWCMLTALSTMPCRPLPIIIPVSSNFLNFPASGNNIYWLLPIIWSIV